MKLSKFVLPFKREVWEYQGSFIGVALAFGGLLLVLTVFGIVQANINAEDIQIQIQSDNFEYDFGDDDFEGGVNNIVHAGLHNFVGAILYAFVLISGFVSFFYLMGTLFDDRKDRSVLFWKSMPVSELQVVLTKFFTGVFVIPLIAITVGLITACILSLVVSAWLPAIVDVGFFEALGKLRIIESLVIVVIVIIISGIWVTPFCAWMMLASAFAKKSPVAWTIAPPVVLVISEKMLLGKSFFLDLLRAYLPDIELLEQVDDSMSLTSLMTLVKSMLASPEIYIGMIVSAAILAACVWLRNNRYEI